MTPFTFPYLVFLYLVATNNSVLYPFSFYLSMTLCSLSFYIVLLLITVCYYYMFVLTKCHWNISFHKKLSSKYVVKNTRTVTHFVRQPFFPLNFKGLSN